MIRTVLLLLLLALAPVLTPVLAPASARESAPVISAHTTATLITDADAHGDQPFRAALRLRLAPGWHSYWQNPGDAGVAPDLAFAPPVTAGPIAWPAPQIVAEGPVITYAYTGDLVLPVTMTAPPGAVALRAHATWLACQRICVPEEGDFAIDLPSGMATPSPEAPLFAAAAAQTPVTSPYAATIAADGTLALDTPGLPAAAVAKAYFFPATAGVIEADAPQTLSARDGALRLQLTPASGFDPKAPLSGLLVLTDAKGGQTYLDVAAKPGGVVADSLARLVLLAMAGGLILNLMPCVFPILAMKAIALAQMAGGSQGRVRTHAAARDSVLNDVASCVELMLPTRLPNPLNAAATSIGVVVRLSGMVFDRDCACEPDGSMPMYSSPSSEAISMCAVLASPIQVFFTRNVTCTCLRTSDTEATEPTRTPATETSSPVVSPEAFWKFAA